MRKNDPLKRQYLIIAVSFGILLLSVAFQYFQLFIGHPFRSSFFSYAWGIYLLFFLLLIVYAVLASRRLFRRTEERRNLARSGDPALLADPQPMADANALPLPSTITLRLNMQFQWIIVGVMLLIFVLAFLGGAIAFSGSHGRSILSNSLFWIIAGIVLAIVVVIMLLTLLLSRFLYNRVFRQELVVDEQGITGRYYGQSTHLGWNEVDSFALWGGKTRRMDNYELRGGDSVVRWFVPKRYRAIFPFRPSGASYEEYCKKIEALNQVVIARSGKPLYDLRDKKLQLW